LLQSQIKQQCLKVTDKKQHMLKHNFHSAQDSEQ